MIDRKKELQTLQEQYADKKASFVVVYGRRRVGKTTLIKEFIKEKQSIYFLATTESEDINRDAFREKVAESFNDELLAAAQINRWDVLFQRIAQESTKNKIVIVIDEFQYIGKSNPAFISVMQKIWDECLINANVMLILCGSLINMMLSQTLSYNSPLYGRRTAQIRLGQIPFEYYREFWGKRDIKFLVESYAITGGVPKYIETVVGEKNIKDIVEKHLLNTNSYLYEEPNFLLQQEVSEIGGYFSILRAIAFGCRKNSDIASALELKATDLARPLKTLQDLDILEREVPVTEENIEKSKKSLYKIKDNFIQFWFKYIYPNKGDIEIGNEKRVESKIESGFIINHVSFVFEDICKRLISISDNIPFHMQKWGRYWDTNTEIDIVGINEESREIVFCECKYHNKPVGMDVLISLMEKSKSVKWQSVDRTEYFVIFSINGYEENLMEYATQCDNVILWDFEYSRNGYNGE